MCNFYVGQKVVCVDAQYDGVGITWENLTEGRQYTVRSVGPACDKSVAPHPHDRRDIVLRLVEIRRRKRDGVEHGYRATRFRPLVETDISIFTAMLSPTPAKRESEDA